MSFYFRPFPKINYDVKKNSSPLLLTDITKRYKIRDILKLAGGLTPNANKKDIIVLKKIIKHEFSHFSLISKIIIIKKKNIHNFNLMKNNVLYI